MLFAKKMANLSSLLMVIFCRPVSTFSLLPFAFSLLLRLFMRLSRKKQAEETPAVKSPEPSEEVKLLREIRDTLQKK